MSEIHESEKLNSSVPFRTLAEPMVRLLRAIALRPWLAAMVVALTSALLAMAGGAARGYPSPSVHDEFAYVLGADTFLHRRLANPTHPMWQHFETFHVLQQPTYSSKYPPANSLFIAAGWALTGRQIGGVWFSFAFMCVAIFWMLRAWLGVTPGFAISLAFASWAAASYWAYTYWGGSVAAGGGALMLGALYRIVEKRGGVRDAIVLATGLLILGNSRPWEGLLVSIPALFVFVKWLIRDKGSDMRYRLTRIVVPLVVIGAVGLACMGVYFKAVTGSWHEMPYAVYQHQRDAIPKLIFQKPAVVEPQTDKTILWFNALEDTTYHNARAISGRVNYVRSVFSDFLALIVPVGLALPLVLLPAAARSQRTKFAIVTLLWTLAVMGLSTWFLPHYAAPLVGLVLVVYGECLLWLSRLEISGKPIGRRMAVATVGVWFLIGIGNISFFYASRMRGSTNGPLQWAVQRRLIADTLSRGGKRNVVVVRYGGTHRPDAEWVYNAADIDGSPVVWARDMGDAENASLLNYFRDRRAWLVEVNGTNGPFRVTSYAASRRTGQLASQ
jgi:hypothetical protein